MRGSRGESVPSQAAVARSTAAPQSSLIILAGVCLAECQSTVDLCQPQLTVRTASNVRVIIRLDFATAKLMYTSTVVGIYSGPDSIVSAYDYYYSTSFINVYF